MADVPDDQNEQLKSAQQYFRQGEYDEAIQAFQQVVEEDPQNLKAHRGLAAAYAQSGKTDLAIEQYRKLTQIDLSNGVAWLNLGAIYIQQGKFQDAVKTIRQGMIKEKRSAIAFYYMGEAHVGLNQTSMAMTGFKEAIKLDPQMINAHIGLGNLYLEMKSHAQAIRHFEDAVKINPDSRRAQEGLRTARTEKDETRDAHNPFGRLVDMDNMGLKGNVALNRNLSDEERLYDRQMVRTISTALAAETAKCLEVMRDDVEQALLKISRTLAEGGASPTQMISSFTNLKEAIGKMHEQRAVMREKIIEVMAHEEIVNTPEFSGFLGTFLGEASLSADTGEEGDDDVVDSQD